MPVYYVSQHCGNFGVELENQHLRQLYCNIMLQILTHIVNKLTAWNTLFVLFVHIRVCCRFSVSFKLYTKSHLHYVHYVTYIPLRQYIRKWTYKQSTVSQCFLRGCYIYRYTPIDTLFPSYTQLELYLLILLWSLIKVMLVYP